MVQNISLPLPWQLLNSIFNFILKVIQWNLFWDVFNALFTFIGFVASKESQEIDADSVTVKCRIQQVIGKEYDTGNQERQSFVVAIKDFSGSHVISDVDELCVEFISTDFGCVAIIIHSFLVAKE